MGGVVRGDAADVDPGRPPVGGLGPGRQQLLLRGVEEPKSGPLREGIELRHLGRGPGVHAGHPSGGRRRRQHSVADPASDVASRATGSPRSGCAQVTAWVLRTGGQGIGGPLTGARAGEPAAAQQQLGAAGQRLDLVLGQQLVQPVRGRRRGPAGRRRARAR